MTQKSALLELPYFTYCDPNFNTCNFKNPLPIKELDDHLDRLSFVLDDLDKQSHRVQAQINELKRLQNDIQRLNNLL